MIKTLIFVCMLIYAPVAYGQFAPAAGVIGSTAIHKDSSVFINWASTVVDFSPGPEDLSTPQSPLVSFGTANEALGAAEGSSFDVVSLGDGGAITLGFEYPITNGQGPDFAVFENSFNDAYLEFAFVEVSTNGTDFVRFPSTSNIQTVSQTDAFGSSDPALVNNLAGKYRQGFGTPFDLQVLLDSTSINIDSINFIKLVDVVGSIDPNYASFDQNGNPINDPFPSPFESSGFDVDGIGVIYQNNPLHIGDAPNIDFVLYPNPANDFVQVKTSLAGVGYRIYDISGRQVSVGQLNGQKSIDLTSISAGQYILQLTQANNSMSSILHVTK